MNPITRKHPRRRQRRRMAQAGFSLIEIMVVVIIIGLLASLVGVAVFNRLADARKETAKSQIKGFQTALDLYRLDCFVYPDSASGLKALAGMAPGNCRNYKKGGYLSSRSVPRDPWKNEYVYQSPGPNGEPYIIYSYGSDGQPGGTDEAGDISSSDDDKEQN